MNQEVEVVGCQSYGNEEHNEVFIGDNNIKTSTGVTDKEDIQALVQVNEESETLENNFFNIPHEFSLHVQESDHKQRESNMDQAISIHAKYVEFFIRDIFFEKSVVLNDGEDTNAGLSTKVQGL